MRRGLVGFALFTLSLAAVDCYAQSAGGGTGTGGATGGSQGTGTADPPAEPQPMDVHLKASRIKPLPPKRVPMGTEVTMKATPDLVASPTYLWGVRCFPNLPNLNNENWNTPTITFCAPVPGTGEFQVLLNHSSPTYFNRVIATEQVVWDPPDYIDLKIASTENKGGGWFYSPHKYTIKCGGKNGQPVGPCALLCIQESVKWKVARRLESLQPFYDRIEIPRWWPPCPTPADGVKGNADDPSMVTWKWTSPTLYDRHGIYFSESVWEYIQGLPDGTLLATETQELGVCWYNCELTHNTLPVVTYVFEWIIREDPQNGGKMPYQRTVSVSGGANP